MNEIKTNRWPLKKVGDTKFFGYVVAIGVCPAEVSSGAAFVYADFLIGEELTRYLLPKGMAIEELLQSWLLENIRGFRSGDGVYGKLHITKTETGYEAQLP